MTTSGSPVPRAVPAGVLAGVVALLAVGLLLWAKWLPYAAKLPTVAGSRSLGSSIVTGGAAAPPPVSLSAGLAFAGTYFVAIGPALLAGLLLAAAVQTVLPSDWVARLVGRGRGAVAGGTLALPGMMCSCCAAPIAVGLRRRAADVRAALAFWLASPALNPVVLAFCAFVLPWPWTVLRLAGGLVVVGLAALLARRGRTVPRDAEDLVGRDAPGDAPDERPLPVRFLTALGGLALRLLPELAVLVVVLGALRGLLFPVGAGLAATHGLVVVGVVVLLAVAGTLLPVPTGAEVAVVAALLAAGVAPAVAAALLLTLPTVSLPSLLMVRRAFPRTLLLGVAGVVVLVGVASALVVAAGGSWGA
ncbi:permease [Actinomycetospora sp. TBRC 11914]|uniref:permease n=1 Tax=Actinomycetospora sp. TBRC 11914 TaxID=2729387 RepID=UPI00145E52AF|nr:permease [Actinomycetospora sp. TBRC 11914]NMO88169.1 permease [Actinomycetospora sp. TBRC 11914]